MSQSATEGNTGQESGANGTQTGQESSQGAGQAGQESDTQGASGFDVNTIQDPAVKAYLETVQRQAQEARNEAAKYRTERNTFQSQITETQRQNESYQDRVTRENTERQERLETLERENRELKVGTAIQAAAADAKAINPAVVARMLDDKVTLDDKGNPTNLQDLVKGLRQSDPYLFKRTRNDAGEGAGQESEPVGNMNDFIRGAARARQGRTT